MNPPALILEGGGMRGAFTAGVLDCWLEHGLRFHTVYGVSAGACQACSYLSGQMGRGIRVWLNYLNDPRFRSVSSLLRTGDLFNADFNYRELPFFLDPVDEEAYRQSGCALHAVVTNLRTGQAEYPLVRSFHQDMHLVQASASLPLISRPVPIDGGLYLDGGVADPIPLLRARADGFSKQVVVLTRVANYRKQPSRGMALLALRYARYPRFVKTLRERHTVYNQTLDQIAAGQRDGSVFVIRPDFPPQIGRIERNPEQLRRLYAQGRAVAERRYKALLAFLI